MWFSLFATVLILAVMFYEGLQGLFTGLINCVLAILAAALAFGLYEDLYYGMLREWQPDHGRAIALMSVFIVSLLVLRTLFDILIKNNLQFPVYVDRAGGGLFGLVTGMIVVGMLSIGFQMLPFGDSVLGFARYELVDGSNEPVAPADAAAADPAELRYRPKTTWLRQDDFTVALVSHLSDNALKGRHQFRDVYPDFMNGTFRARARMGENSQVTPPNGQSITVESYREIKQSEFFARQQKKDKQTSKKMVALVASKKQPEGGSTRLAVQCAFQEAKLDFTTEHVRLVARDEKTGRASESILVGLSDQKAGKLVEAYDGEMFSFSLGKSKQIEFVFDVPAGIEFGEGSFVEYKLNARAEITPSHDESKAKGKKRTTGKGPSKSPPPKPATPDGDSTGSGGNDSGGGTNTGASNNSGSSGQGGRVSGIGPARGFIVGNDLPFELTQYSGPAEVSGAGEMKGGHIYAALGNDWQPAAGSDKPIKSIDVPSDMRLLQVSVEKLHPGSTLGQALGFARDMVADFYLVDKEGNKFLPVGKYAMAKVNGKPIFELILLDETARSGKDVFTKLPSSFDRIKRADLKNDYALYFIFQVPPGTRPVRINTGSSVNSVQLEQFNIVVD